jgi:ATP-dependent Zn protease
VIVIVIVIRGTPGFSGAELFNLMNQAALKASIEGLKSVGMSALEYAKDKIMMGAERRSAVISPETIKMTVSPHPHPSSSLTELSLLPPCRLSTKRDTHWWR